MGINIDKMNLSESAYILWKYMTEGRQEAYNVATHSSGQISYFSRGSMPINENEFRKVLQWLPHLEGKCLASFKITDQLPSGMTGIVPASHKIAFCVLNKLVCARVGQIEDGAVRNCEMFFDPMSDCIYKHITPEIEKCVAPQDTVDGIRSILAEKSGKTFFAMVDKIHETAKPYFSHFALVGCLTSGAIALYSAKQVVNNVVDGFSEDKGCCNAMGKFIKAGLWGCATVATSLAAYATGRVTFQRFFP